MEEPKYEFEPRSASVSGALPSTMRRDRLTLPLAPRKSRCTAPSKEEVKNVSPDGSPTAPTASSGRPSQSRSGTMPSDEPNESHWPISSCRLPLSLLIVE